MCLGLFGDIDKAHFPFLLDLSLSVKREKRKVERGGKLIRNSVTERLDISRNGVVLIIIEVVERRNKTRRATRIPLPFFSRSICLPFLL